MMSKFGHPASFHFTVISPRLIPGNQIKWSNSGSTYITTYCEDVILLVFVKNV